MIYENISYPNHLPFKISFANVTEENYHYHKDLEMSFVLRGTTNYKIHHLDYRLKEGQIIIVDGSDLHRIYDSSPDILTLTIHIDLSFFEDIYPNLSSSIFVCEALDEKDVLEYQTLQNKNKILKRILTKIMIAYVQEMNSEILLTYVKDLITTLVEEFQSFVFSETNFKADKRLLKDMDMQRYLKISNYLYTNYQEKISLETIADYLHLSPYYVSHLVKYISGLNFKNYLNYVRVEYSEKLLAEQILTLTEICETCGFSSLTYFNKCFALWHKKSPTEYRRALPTCTRTYGNDFLQSEAFLLLSKFNDSYELTNTGTSSPTLYTNTIVVDFKERGEAYFRANHSLKIVLNSYEDIVLLSHYRTEILALKPAEIILSKDALKNMSASLKNSTYLLLDNLNIAVTESLEPVSTCSNLHSLLQFSEKKNLLLNKFISLTEDSTRLIHKNGLLSSTYHILKIVSAITGNIVVERNGYLITNDGKSIYLLLYKTETQNESYCNISFKNSFSKIFITEQHFENKDKYTKIINEFAEIRNISPAILHEINTSFYNKKTYTLEGETQNLSFSLVKTGVILLKIVRYK